VITQWNDEEDEALQGCSLLAQAIYLRGIRRFMKYETGIAGNPAHNPKIKTLSLSGLADIAQFSPDWGSKKKAWIPGKEEIRAALEELKRANLIEDRGSCLRDGLIFFLPKADANQSVQKRNPIGTPQEPHDDEPHAETGAKPNEIRGSMERNPTRNPTGENTGNPTQRIDGYTDRERDTPPPPTEPEREGALAGARRRGHLAALFREAHVGITSMHPALVEWVSAGLTDAEAGEAIERARVHKPAPQKIPANYLVPIVGQVVAEREGKRKPPATSHGTPGASQTKRGHYDSREFGVNDIPGLV